LNFDPANPYPAILAFGGGPQTIYIVEGTLTRGWREQAARLSRDCPGSARWRAVLRRRARVFPEFLTPMLADY
jgi:hypothetical protein